MSKISKTQRKTVRMKEMLGEIGTKEFIEKLEGIGYFSYPASIKHHGNHPGGLFEHSFNVAKTLMKLTEQNGLKWQRPESPAIIGFFHDLCKLDDYSPTGGKVELFGGIMKDPDSWEYNPWKNFTGHGEKSVMIAATLLQLTEEEVKCIRYHMGAFTEKADWEYYTRAINDFPNVLWVHHADMIAAHIVEVGDDE